MTLRLKILSLGVLAVLATSAYAVNASAIESGHFTSEVGSDHHLILKGTDGFGTGHALVFRKGAQEGITCTHASYHGTISGAASTTTKQVTLRPHYTECATESGVWGEVTVHVPTTCGTEVFKFTSRTPNGHGTVHLNCTITITHPNCVITVHPQTPDGGVVYKTDTTTGVHSITGEVTATEIEATYHSGLCIFLGTNQVGYTMEGSTTLWGENTKAEKVGITAT